jgi:hypothetical protein
MKSGRLTLLLLSILTLSGCDKLKTLTGGETLDPKAMDAEAVGYACRVSQKAPEACMKENEVHSPSSVLNGWKKADADIKVGTIDPSMSNERLIIASAVPAAEAEGEHEAEAEDEKPAKSGKKDDKSDGSAHDDKSEKSEKSGKPEKDNKSNHNESTGKPASKSH